MKELGEILRKRRLEKKLTIEYIAEKIRVRHNYLEIIESGDFQESDIYMIGYIKNYGSFLGVDYKKYLDRNKNNNNYIKSGSSEDGEEQYVQNAGSPSLSIVTISITAIIITVGLLFFLKNYNYTYSSKNEGQEAKPHDVIKEVTDPEASIDKKIPKIQEINSFHKHLDQLDDVSIIIFKATKPNEISVFDVKDDLIVRKQLKQGEIFEYQIEGRKKLKIFTNSAKSIDIDFK